MRLSCPYKVHLSQANSGSGLPVSLLTPLSSSGPLEEGGSSSDRTTLTAHQPQPDTFLKAEPGRSQCSLLPFVLCSISHSLFYCLKFLQAFDVSPVIKPSPRWLCNTQWLITKGHSALPAVWNKFLWSDWWGWSKTHVVQVKYATSLVLFETS